MTGTVISVLTIAGSDSGGGAGIQMDLRVFQRLGVFGTCAITATTAQNLDAVAAVHGLPELHVLAQIDSVLSCFPVKAAKTGMLWSAATVRAVALRLQEAEVPVVVDPVLVATSGARLLDPGAIDSYRTELLPHAALVTPNLDEAAALLDQDVCDQDTMHQTARALTKRFGVPFLLKGGHLLGDPVDILAAGRRLVVWRHPRIEDVNTHGSGCMLSAAITARLATGQPLEQACAEGLAFVHSALSSPRRLSASVVLAGVENANLDVSVLERIE